MTLYDEDRVVTLLREIEVPLGAPDRLGVVRRRARRQESRRLTALAGVLAVLLGAGVVSALSFDDQDGVEQLSVADAARTTRAAGTARMTMHVTVTKSSQPGFPTGDVISVSGPVDFRARRYLLKGSLMHRRVEIRGIDTDEWTKVDLTGTVLGIAGEAPSKPWVHTSQNTSEGSLNDLGELEPTHLLEALTTKGTTLSTSTTGDRVRTVLRVPADILGALGTEAAARTVDVTVESDGAGLIRELTYVQEVPGLGSLRASIAYDDFGIEVDVQPPPAGEIGDPAQILGGPLGEHGGEGELSQEACAGLDEQLEQLPADVPAEKRAALEKILAEARKACLGKK
jgi:hypothetical protein